MSVCACATPVPLELVENMDLGDGLPIALAGGVRIVSFKQARGKHAGGGLRWRAAAAARRHSVFLNNLRERRRGIEWVLFLESKRFHTQRCPLRYLFIIWTLLATSAAVGTLQAQEDTFDLTVLSYKWTT